LQNLENEKDLFILVASFLRKHEYSTSPDFSRELQALLLNKSRKIDATGSYKIPPYIDELFNALTAIYDASPIVVNYRRGAIVELLSYRLVLPRCQLDECRSNYRFLYPSRRHPYDKSDQVDVAVLSKTKNQIEGYCCKMQGRIIKFEDCTNLRQLVCYGEEDGYTVHVGVVCFDSTKNIERRLKNLSSEGQNLLFDELIRPYGLDNFASLRRSPFFEH
jgi:hypothetical protein